jgi:hypothetical protein
MALLRAVAEDLRRFPTEQGRIEMSNEPPVQVDDDAIQWESFTSEKGNKYDVGYLKSAPPADGADAMTATSNKHAFGITVDWPVGTVAYTDATITARAAITRYMLVKYDGFYEFKLEFDNTEHYNYRFHDETGDSYKVNTFRNGGHFVRYDSARPNIVYVTGS